MSVLINAALKVLSWLGTIFLVRRGAKKEVVADANQEALDAVKDASRPVGDDELERVRKEFRRD